MGTLHSIAALDEEFLNEYLEPTFAAKLIDSLKKYKELGYKLEIYQDDTGIRGEPITEGISNSSILFITYIMHLMQRNLFGRYGYDQRLKR